MGNRVPHSYIRSGRVGVPIVRWLTLCLVLVWSVSLARPDFAPISFAIETESSRVAFNGELATTPEQITYGLMFRTSLPDDYAMVFDFTTPKQAGFWMKNTLIPLDMIFVKSNGVIANIIADVPPLTLDLRKSYGKVRWVIEVPAGTTTKHGIASGNRVRF